MIRFVQLPLYKLLIGLFTATILLGIQVSTIESATTCDPNAPLIRASVPLDGSGGVGGENALTGDGRYAFYSSYDSSLVLGDTNGSSDIFMYDRITCQTTRISVSSTGKQGNCDSYAPVISTNGQYVVFKSTANNFVLGDDIFPYPCYDTLSNSPLGEDIFVLDRITKQISRISSPLIFSISGYGTNYHISPNGQYIVIQADPSNLAPNRGRVFVYDGGTKQTHQIPLTLDINLVPFGTPGYPIGITDTDVIYLADGPNCNTYPFTDCHNLFKYDLQTQNVIWLQTNVRSPYSYALSKDGHYLAAGWDIYDLYHIPTQIIETYDNRPSAFSADGRFFAYKMIPQGYGVYVHDREKNLDRTIISCSCYIADEIHLSDDGYYVSFDAGLLALAPDTWIATNSLAPVTSLPDAAPPINYYVHWPIHLTWNPVTWATEYQIEVDSSPNFDPPLDYSIILDPNWLSTDVLFLEDGTYYWHIRARHSDYSWGNWSELNSFTVKTD